MDHDLSGNHDRPTLTSARQWQATFDAIQDGIYILDKEHRILQCNRAFCNLVGLPIEQIIGCTCWEVVHKTGLPMETCPERSMRQTLHRQTQEFAFGERWLEAIVDPMLDADGHLVTTIHILSDITRRKQIEDALSKSEEGFRRLFENMTDGFAVHEMIYDSSGKPVDYRFLGVNAAFERMTGLTAAQVIGQTALSVIPELENSWIERYGRVVLYGEAITFEDSSPALGRTYQVTAYCSGAHQFATVISDVSERRQMLDELHSSEESYRQLFEMGSDALFLIERETGSILQANPAASKMYGYTNEELLKLRNVDLSVEQSATRQATQGGTTSIPRRMHRKKDGTIFPVDITAAHFTWHGKVVHLAAIRDATERDRAETILRKREAILATAERVAGMGSWEYDVASETAVCSVNMFQIYDLNPAKPDALLPENFLQHVVYAPDRDKVRQQLEAALAHKVVYDLEYRIVRSDGAIRDIHAVADTFFNDEGKPIRMVGSLQDITERKRTEAILKDRLEELRRWHDITLGRETRILELKREVNHLLQQAGLPPRYASAQED